MEKSEIKGFIAKRVAQELKDGDVVNLGIGLPTLVPAYLPEGVEVILQSENGIIGTGAKPSAEEADPKYKTDAGGQPAQAAPFGCYIDSATSFGFIRGGHVNATILGGLEVDEEGSLSNWIIPGKKMPGMGGAMDLLVGAKEVIVGHGPAGGRQGSHRGHGAHRQGQAQDSEEVHPALHRRPLRHQDHHRDVRDQRDRQGPGAGGDQPRVHRGPGQGRHRGRPDRLPRPEAHVLKPEYTELFSDEERKLCRDRLKEFGYPVD